jgi:HAD superfamily hydrolase (TIGR01490 family)|tara:strand:+ start:13029 stop:13712 length:684 start_codon:yes stop_codon:yes gene_type:complete
MKKVAIFDVDGTIFRSSLLVELVERLVEEEIFPQNAREEYQKEYALWLDRKGDYDDYIDTVVKSFMTYIKGVHYGEFMNVSEAVVFEHQNRVYRYSRDLIKDLKKKKYYLLAISQSPKAILEKFCKQLGFDKVYGRIYELGPEDKFTGELVDVHLISNKANIVNRAIEKEGLTLEGSVGVGDTENDVSFLEMVEKPICFNPNSGLYRHAKRLGWKIIVERKDVIYEL